LSFFRECSHAPAEINHLGLFLWPSCNFGRILLRVCHCAFEWLVRSISRNWRKDWTDNYDVTRISWTTDVKMVVFRWPQVSWQFQTFACFLAVKQGVNPVTRSWKTHLLEWGGCHEAFVWIYYTEKWRAETLRSGLEIDNFKPPGLKAVSSNAYPGWMVRFWGVMLRFFESGSPDLSYGTNYAL
jgi:hypothetical protein